MEDAKSVATLLESTSSKIQQLQRAFAELESHRAVTLNLKWKQIEDHFHGLEKSLKRRFTELEDQEKEFEMKTTQSRQILEKRQAAVVAKEEASLERLQEKRDVAVAAIANVLNKRRNGITETETIVENKPPDDMERLSESDVKALSNPELAKLCEENDAQGLHKFISDNRKNISSIKEEIPIALKAAADPGGLVLDSLSGFYMSSSEDGKKDSNLLGQRRTCIMLMECLSILLTNLSEKFVSKVISKDVKERARVIADEWKPKLDDLDVDASNGNSLEAHAFLQLVATFGIDSDFVQDDLSKLIPMVCRRRQTADLCRFLGLSDKIPGVIDVLVKNGRHIDAVNLTFAFELTEQFSPVSILKSYLTEARRVPSAIKSANLSPTAQATDLTSRVEIGKVSDRDERRLVLDLHIARAKTAWEVSDRNLAVNLLNRAKGVLFGVADSYLVLANQFMCFGKVILSTSEGSSDSSVKLMSEALELCEKGLRSVKKAEETLALKEFRSKTLRFMAAAHLQRDEFESVLKCVRVSRDGEKGEHHPSLSVLAMKAWLGLGRYGEAEKELKSMVVNKGVPEGVWVSAMECYLQAVGSDGVETAMGVFLGVLERCDVSAGAAIRVVQRVVADCVNGEGVKGRAKVVAEFVSNDKVVAVFAGEVAAKERSGMHALLWNCAADHFRSKDYEVSAELFEKSLLYVPHDIENRSLRAKGFRVLCLCHLALSHLDRAQEYIDEAAKLEPNIACVFLKFKICLQNNDHDDAITQVQAMPACIDFTPDFLSLSAHEAIACRALSVAVDSLSRLLTFFSMGKPMPTTEVIVFRTLITILIQQPHNEKEVLKYMKRAHSRFSDLGPERFFGSGEVGRRERNWFALNLWNIGLKSGQEKNYDLCGELFRMGAEYYGVSIDGDLEGNNQMVCKSLILAVSAMLAGEKLSQKELSDNEVKQATELLERAGKILMSGATKTRIDDDQASTIEPHFYFIYTLSAYDLYTRTNDTESKQLLLIKNYANSKYCNTNHLLQIGLNASEGPRPNTEVATFCLNTCISLLLSSSSPDYQTVALVLRKLITITSAHKCNTAADEDGNDEDGVYGLYKKAYRIMVGLKAGEYPVEEGKWLAMTAWNRAALPVRLGQVVEAKKWMDMGLELAGRVVGMDTYKSCMEDFVSGVEKKVQSQGHLIVGS